MPPGTSRAAVDHASMRESNRAVVIALLREHERLSRADLSKLAALAKPTVSAIVEELISADLAREVGMGATTKSGGRPPILLEFNERSEFLAGVHVGVRRTTVVIADALGQEVARRVVDTPRTPRTALRRIAETIRLTAADAGADAVVTVGVTLPGLVDVRRGVCRLAPNLGWKDVAVAEPLSEELGVPVVVHNTSQAVAVSEQLEGVARGASDVAVLYAGSGLGCGVLSGGELVDGNAGLAGEIGHCAVPGNTHACRCGKTGCLESIASSWALVRDAEAAVADGTGAAIEAAAGGAPVSVEHVLTTAAGGDAVATRLVTDLGAALGIAASWLVNLVDPEVLVLTGGLVSAGPLLLDSLLAAAAQHTLAQSWSAVRLETSELGQDAEVRGAVVLALRARQAHT